MSAVATSRTLHQQQPRSVLLRQASEPGSLQLCQCPSARHPASRSRRAGHRPPGLLPVGPAGLRPPVGVGAVGGRNCRGLLHLGDLRNLRWRLEKDNVEVSTQNCSRTARELLDKARAMPVCGAGRA